MAPDQSSLEVLPSVVARNAGEAESPVEPEQPYLERNIHIPAARSISNSPSPTHSPRAQSNDAYEKIETSVQLTIFRSIRFHFDLMKELESLIFNKEKRSKSYPSQLSTVESYNVGYCDGRSLSAGCCYHISHKSKIEKNLLLQCNSISDNQLEILSRETLSKSSPSLSNSQASSNLSYLFSLLAQQDQPQNEWRDPRSPILRDMPSIPSSLENSELLDLRLEEHGINVPDVNSTPNDSQSSSHSRAQSEAYYDGFGIPTRIPQQSDTCNINEIASVLLSVVLQYICV